MSKLTEVLKLLCYDPETDGNLTFNVTEALTKNWEKIDAWASGIKSTLIGKASLGENGAVPVEQGGTGATMAQAALAALGAGVRPSKIINGAFQINQRGQDSYTGTWSYCFDGWVLASNTTATRNSNGDIIISNTSDSLKGYILQRIENPIFDTESTFSLLTTDGLFWTTGNMDSISHNTFSEETPFGNITVEYDSDNRQYVAVTLNEGQSITLPASKGDVAKFEDGNTQTLAYQDSDGAWHLLPQPESDYATQMKKCQRYLLDITPNIIFNQSYIAICTYAGSLFVCIPIPVSMRLAPSFDGDASSFQIAYPDGAFGVPTSIRVVTYSSGYVGLSILADSAAAGQVADIRLADSSKKWFLNAEL